MERLADTAIPDRRDGSNRWPSWARQGRARFHDPSDRYTAAATPAFQLSVARASNRAYLFVTVFEARHAAR
jgi:hypothetical protein